MLTKDVIDDFEKWWIENYGKVDENTFIELTFKELSIRLAEYVASLLD
jgi:hypothetical protein